MPRLIATVWMLLLGGACSLNVDSYVWTCTTDEQCGPGVKCTGGVCQVGAGVGRSLDAGATVDGGAGGGPQGTIPITPAGCATFSSNDTSPEGTWYLKALCLGGVRLFPTVEPDCLTATSVDLTGTASGELSLTGVQATRSLTLSVSGKVRYPLDCVGSACDALALDFNALQGVTATCTAEAGGGCLCPFTLNRTEYFAGNAFWSGGLLSLQSTGGPTLQYDYGVQGPQLEMRAREAPEYRFSWVR